jgi:hypothetical protein
MPNIQPDTNLQLVCDYLKSRGTAGSASTEMAVALGKSAKAVHSAVHKAEKRGLVEWWPEPMGRCANRRRWYAAGMRPKVAPPPVPMRPVRKPDAPANGVRAFVDPRFHVELPAGYRSALSPSECRPWAAAAAEARA